MHVQQCCFCQQKSYRDILPNYICNTNDDLEWALTICQFEFGVDSQTIVLSGWFEVFEEGYMYEALNNFVNCYDPTLCEW